MLQILNQHSLPNKKVAERCTMHVNMDKARFSFNQHAVSLLGLSDGAQVAFSYEDDSSGKSAEWYVLKVDEDGYKVNLKKGAHAGNSMSFTHKALADKLAADFKLGTAKTITLRLADEPTEVETDIPNANFYQLLKDIS